MPLRTKIPTKSPYRAATAEAFRGGHDAAVNSAEDDDGNHKRPFGAPYAGEHLTPCMPFRLSSPAVFPGYPPCDNHQQQSGEETGHDAAHEQLAYGNIGDDAVQDKWIAWGDHGADGARAGNKSSGKGAGISAFHHGRHDNHADGGHSGQSGTGNCAEKRACHNGGQGKPAGAPTHELVGKVEEIAERPPLPMNTPAAMKKNMASMGKESREVKLCCAATFRDR